MDKQTILVLGVLIALIAGFTGGYVVRGGQVAENYHMMSSGGMMHNNSMGSAMDDMMSGLEGRRGDDFDQAFLSEMILHHQSAVEMAEAALRYAKHQEIKDMADAIISAQTSEINQMRMWSKSWYTQ